VNTKQRRETRKAELVETHNIALSIERLQGAPYDSGRWKRALYHAVAMSGVGNEYARKIREALELP
jgi:hypothetical protein